MALLQSNMPAVHGRSFPHQGYGQMMGPKGSAGVFHATSAPAAGAAAAPVSALSGLKCAEMSPETTLVEFISTSASFHNVRKCPILKVEWDILKVFPNNIMPANAAAWYMAKRRFYMNNAYEAQLLPTLLKNHPRKFAIVGNEVEFLETYKKDVARTKLHQLLEQGLQAYFTHKVEEYGVYFFDPIYYETTEPFHANLKEIVTDRNHSKLVKNYFKKHSKDFVFQSHSPYLVTISKQPVEVCINTTGIIVSIVDNQFGIIQFRQKGSNETEKAFFSAKSLFRDGWIYSGDPMKLPPMKFDGYKIPNGGGRTADHDYSWYAVLVWCGRKPSPKFCATKEDLSSGSPYFKGTAGGPLEDISFKMTNNVPNVGYTQVGEVVALKDFGAEVCITPESDDRVVIQGWMHGNRRLPKQNFVTTTQGVELALHDMISFTIHPEKEMAGYKAVGVNVMVLRHSNKKGAKARTVSMSSEVNPFTNVDQGTNQGKKGNRRNRTKSSASRSEESYQDSGTSGKSLNKNRKNQTKESNNNKENKGQKAKQLKNKYQTYSEFLMVAELEEEDAYDSDRDPFYCPMAYDSDLDLDEYDNESVSQSEYDFLLNDEPTADQIEELRKQLEEFEMKQKEENVEKHKVNEEEAIVTVENEENKGEEEESKDENKKLDEEGDNNDSKPAETTDMQQSNEASVQEEQEATTKNDE